MSSRKTYITPPVDADSIQGVPISEEAPFDGAGLVYDADSGEWKPVAGGAGGGASVSASYVTVGSEAGLTAERVLTAGTNISILDNGPGSTVVISATGAAGDPGADYQASFVVMGVTSSLPNERALTAGTGIRLTDGGAGSTATMAINDAIVATISGSTFTGPINAQVTGSLTRTAVGTPFITVPAGQALSVSTGSNGQVVLSVNLADYAPLAGATFNGPISAQVTGSLTQTSAGTPFITAPAGNVITITTGANGQIVLSGSGGAGAPQTQAQYLVLQAEADLTQERVMTAGTGLKAVDAGAGNAYTLSVHDGTFAALSGANFTGVTTHATGLSGSLTRLTDGRSFIVAGAGITINSSSNGQIEIVGLAGSSSIDAPINAQYVVLNLDGTLTDERVLTAGNGLKLADGGAGGNATLTIHDAIVATVSGTRFTGVTYHSAGLESTFARLGGGNALAGELRLPGGINGWSFRQRNSISTGYDRFPMYGYEESGEAILGIGHDWTGPATVGSYTRTYVGGNVEVSQFITVTSSLGNTLGTTLTYWTGSNMRAFMTDGESNNPVNFGIMGFRSALDNPNHAFGGGKGVFYFGQAANYPSSSPTQGVVLWVDSGSYNLHYRRPNGTIVDVLQDSGHPSDYASLTGSTFTGVTNHNAGLSGSLTRLTDGRSYIVAGANVTVSSESNGQVTVSADTKAPTDSQYLVLALDSTLSNERTLTPGTGLKAVDAGAGAAYTLSVHDGTFAALSGAQFTGPVSFASDATFNGALTGSLTKLVDGSPFITVVPNNIITISTSSAGQIILSGNAGFGGGGGAIQAQYLVLQAEAALSDERVFTPGSGLKASDAGAGGAYTLSVHDGTFAALSGANFTGPITAGNAQLTGSITVTAGGTPFITAPAGNSVTVTTGANGQVIISGSGGGGGLDVTPNLIQKDSFGRLEFYLSSSLGGVGTVTAVPALRHTITHAHHLLFINSGSHQWLEPSTLTASMVVTCSTAGAVTRDHMSIYVMDTNYDFTVCNGGGALGTLFSSSIGGARRRAVWDIVYDGANWVLGSITRLG